MQGLKEVRVTERIHVGDCTPGVLYELNQNRIVASTFPFAFPFRPIYKTLISCDEELMDRRALPRIGWMIVDGNI